MINKGEKTNSPKYFALKLFTTVEIGQRIRVFLYSGCSINLEYHIEYSMRMSSLSTQPYSLIFFILWTMKIEMGFIFHHKNHTFYKF